MLRYLLVFTVLMFLSSCSSSRSPTEIAQNSTDDGYGRVSKKNQTGSVSSETKFDVARPLEMHLSTLPGVTVRGQGAGAEVRIRGGMNSFSVSTEPLFVLDGQPVNGGFNSIYAVVNVADLSEISVLKGSSASMYGSRGANGVILIRTKRE